MGFICVKNRPSKTEPYSRHNKAQDDVDPVGRERQRPPLRRQRAIAVRGEATRRARAIPQPNGAAPRALYRSGLPRVP